VNAPVRIVRRRADNPDFMPLSGQEFAEFGCKGPVPNYFGFIEDAKEQDAQRF
jgi:hypothetical protein